jgi:hypothetical protein
MRLRFLPALVYSLYAGALWAQADTAALSGRVTDPSGAVIPAAEVTATNTATGVSSHTKTNDAGVYSFPALPPSEYRLMVRAKGFQQVERAGLLLHLQDRVSQDIAMPVGSSEQTVVVTGDAAQANTDSAAVGTVVSREFVANLPLNGRSFQSLITLTPTVVVTPVTSGSPGQFSINGQRADSNYMTVDGVSANISVGAGAAVLPGSSGSGQQPSASGGFNNLASLDSIQEFKIQTSTFAPEFGRSPGGQISVVTRGGTNQFHGAAFDYLRNNVLDANDWFLNTIPPKPGIPVHPPERQNDFGGVFGGPAWKNKIFFFFSYEGLRLVQPTPLLKQVPSLCARGTGPCPAGSTAAVPEIRPYLAAYPLPTAGGCGSALPPSPDPLLSPVCQGYPATVSSNSYSIRSDYNVNSRLNTFLRFVRSPSKSTARSANATSLFNTVPDWTTWTAGATYVLSPTLLNDLRFNYSLANGDAYSTLDTFGGAVPISSSDPNIFPNISAPGTGKLTPDNTRFFITYSPATAWRFGEETKNQSVQWNFIDSFAVMRGKHQMKFGADFRRITPIQGRAPYQQSYTFLTSAAMNSGVANTYLSLLNPYVISLFYNVSFYAQDTWKATPRLTVTYGLRWEYNPPPGSTNGYPFVGLNQLNLGSLAATQVAPIGSSVYHTQWDAFAPRLGVAYRLSKGARWGRVIRAGWGMFYDIIGDYNSLATVNGPNVSLGSVKFPATPTQQDPRNLNPNPNQAPWPNLVVFDPNLRLPRVHQMSVAFEQTLGEKQLLTVTYAGAIGRKLLLQEIFAAPNTNNLPSGFQAISNVGSSDYHSLQALFQRRLSGGLQVMASYVWGHSIDTGSYETYSVPNLSVQHVSRERGSSDFDIRQSFQAAVTYDLPAPSRNRFVRAIAGNWGSDFIFRARSAPPANITDSAVNFSQFTPAVNLAERPNVVPGQPFFLSGAACGAAYKIASCPGGMGLNKAAFAAPVAGVQGDLGRNLLRGFGWNELDFTLRRQFPIHERVKLQFRADLFNIFNHPSFAITGNSLNIANAAFGTASSMLNNSLFVSGSVAGFNPLFQIGGPRSIQASMKLVF